MTKKFPYTWSGNPCVRCGEPMYGESHPCYYCGTILKIDDTYKPCKKCEFAPCPDCGGCLCNLPVAKRSAAIYLRDKYCCDLTNFQTGYQEIDNWALELVPAFKVALDYCREKRGFK